MSAAARKRVLLTGATGNWGRCVLEEFARRSDRFEVVALVPPTARDRRVIGGFAGMGNLSVVFGDLTDDETVRARVRGVDYVLHLAAVVSPYADDHPDLTHRVNVGAARSIVRAVRAQPDPDAIGVVMVGSTGRRSHRRSPTAPRHTSRTGMCSPVARG